MSARASKEKPHIFAAKFRQMNRTRLGISVGLLAAGLFLAPIVSGTLGLILLVGYVLLFETDPWLRRAATKAAVVVFFFGLLGALINLIPNAIGLINHAFSIFGGNFSLRPISGLVGIANALLAIVQTLFLISLALKAYKHIDGSHDRLDGVLNQHFEGEHQVVVEQPVVVENRVIVEEPAADI